MRLKAGSGRGKMKILALTHAHLNAEGLSPVSCERADSFTGVWAKDLSWNVDVVFTKGTKWRGIWHDGQGLKVNIINVSAPASLMMSAPQLFSAQVKNLLTQKRFPAIASLAIRRVFKKARQFLAAKGWVFPYEMVKAEQWGRYLSGLPQIKNTAYDVIFVCVGFGDEYLLQTALTMSHLLKVPTVVDMRDLWSDHHDPRRFTDVQRRLIRTYERRLLNRALLISVPQEPMAAQLRTYLEPPVFLASHSAYVEPGWPDGSIISDEFRLFYSGKLYFGNPGLDLILDLLKELSGSGFTRPVKCHFFVDDTAKLKSLVAARGIENMVVVHDWVTPGALWQQMRSAHVLLTFDGGVQGGMPLLMTKSFQYAYSGRPVLALCPFENSVYEDFFATYNAGAVYHSGKEAALWIAKLMADEKQYSRLPPLRTAVPTRSQVAREYGLYIYEVLKKYVTTH